MQQDESLQKEDADKEQQQDQMKDDLLVEDPLMKPLEQPLVDEGSYCEGNDAEEMKNGDGNAVDL